MNLNETASAFRTHIAFFGRRNAGKSSLVNAVTGQKMSIVSDVAGTTTDAVKKSMELLPIGPVVIIDTPGIDDFGELGELRVNAAKKVLAQTDVAVLVVDASIGLNETDKELLALFKTRNVPYVIALNKRDLIEFTEDVDENAIFVSAATGEGVNELKEFIAEKGKAAQKNKPLVGDLIKKGDNILLVIPIDKAAPKGRLIMPQQMVMRDILDTGCAFTACQNNCVKQTLESIKKPALVITDSQVFEQVGRDVPEEIPLTSFSILIARYKGNLQQLIEGANRLDKLNDGDKVLISEACTHHRQCGDIGTQKLPKWISEYTGKKLEFSFTSGLDFIEQADKYALIVHCGGCMINEKEMSHRLNLAMKQNVPIVNYGIAIAKMHGILQRSIEIFNR